MDTNTATWARGGARAAGPDTGSDQARWPATAAQAGAAGFSHEASDAFGAIGYEAADPSLQERLWQEALPDLRRLWHRA